MRVLIVESHPALARTLKNGLEEEGFAVDVAGDGREGADKVLRTDYSAIVLASLLPDEAGLALLRRWRAAGVGAPILVLTAPGHGEEGVRALDLGADAYLARPFRILELSAHVRALVRSRYVMKNPVLSVDDLQVNTRCSAPRFAPANGSPCRRSNTPCWSSWRSTTARS
jgi:DNA-binding response OmpR family regulator